ncbi:MAG: L-threonylcarbamoyladenylate synthase [Bradymonadia bacterium]|jgi:L-threonylcarbamoyladenylate synthase
MSEALETLLAGGVLLAPTDTVLGLIASPRFPSAVSRVFELKDRPQTVNLPILIPNAAAAESLGFEVSQVARTLLTAFAGRGTVTVVLGFQGGEREDWLSGRDEAAMRVPNDEWLLALLNAAGPLLATSANRHGEQTPATTQEAAASLQGVPDCIVPGLEGSTAPSTIVNCRTSPATIERSGAFAEEIQRIIERHHRARHD